MASEAVGALKLAASYDRPGHIDVLCEVAIHRGRESCCHRNGVQLPIRMNGSIDPRQHGRLPKQTTTLAVNRHPVSRERKV